jgi:hypothetical protein
MESLKVDRTKLYTITEYAKKINKTTARVSQMVKADEVKVVRINGAKLVYSE